MNSCTPDFGRAAADYARYRVGFPAELLERLGRRGVVRAGMRVVDLGTGTGSLARLFARAGCEVVGVDISAPLLDQARKLDQENRLHIEYVEGAAESTGLPSHEFDLVSAGQCWHWFDRAAAAREVVRLLVGSGVVVIVHLDWLAFGGNVVEATQEIIVRFTPPGDPAHGAWRFARGTGVYPQWLSDLQSAGFTSIETFSFDLAVRYSHENWVGRVRASAPIGGALDNDGVRAFSDELAAMLRLRFPADPQTVPHRVWAVTARSPQALPHRVR